VTSPRSYFRPVIKEVVEPCLDCGTPRSDFDRIRCPDCGEERLLLDVRQLFTKIDFVAQPDAYCQCGQEERFIGWSGYLPRREKSKFLQLKHIRLILLILSKSFDLLCTSCQETKKEAALCRTKSR
jgi:DNA-directed RNA polymerase subunit RPC12/RpoP